MSGRSRSAKGSGSGLLLNRADSDSKVTTTKALRSGDVARVLSLRSASSSTDLESECRPLSSLTRACSNPETFAEVARRGGRKRSSETRPKSDSPLPLLQLPRTVSSLVDSAAPVIPAVVLSVAPALPDVGAAIAPSEMIQEVPLEVLAESAVAPAVSRFQGAPLSNRFAVFAGGQSVAEVLRNMYVPKLHPAGGPMLMSSIPAQAVRSPVPVPAGAKSSKTEAKNPAAPKPRGRPSKSAKAAEDRRLADEAKKAARDLRKRDEEALREVLVNARHKPLPEAIADDVVKVDPLDHSITVASCPRAPRTMKSFMKAAFSRNFTEASFALSTADLSGPDFVDALRSWLTAPSRLAQSCRRVDLDSRERMRRALRKARYEEDLLVTIRQEIASTHGSDLADFLFRNSEAGLDGDAQLGECGITDAQAARVQLSVVAGEVSRATNVIRQVSGPASAFTADDLNRFFVLHPAPRPLPQDPSFVYPRVPSHAPTVYIDMKDVSAAVLRLSSTAAPGPSGMSADHLKSSIKEPNFLFGLTALVNRIANGDIPDDIRASLTAGNLYSIFKRFDVVNGVKTAMYRPIVCGEEVVKLTSKILLSSCISKAVSYLQPIQLGVGVPGGCEAVIHTAQSWAEQHPDWVILKVDMENAFNSMDRQLFLKKIYSISELSSLWKLVSLLYSADSPLYLRDRDAIVGTMLSRRGVRQGDVLGPLLFALGIQDFLLDMVSSTGVQCRAILDDIFIAGPASNCIQAFQFLQSNLFSRTGLTMSAPKTEFYSPQFVSSDPARASRDHVGIVTLCNEVGAKLVLGTGGLRALGSVIGVNDAARRCLVAEAFDATRVLISKLQHKSISAQSAILILRQCTTSTFNYVFRTLPPQLCVDVAADLRKLLVEAFCLLTATPLRLILEHKYLLDTLFLSTKYGGFGLQDPTAVLSSAYIASVALSACHIGVLVPNRPVDAAAMNGKAAAPQAAAVRGRAAGGEDGDGFAAVNASSAAAGSAVGAGFGAAAAAGAVAGAAERVRVAAARASAADVNMEDFVDEGDPPDPPCFYVVPTLHLTSASVPEFVNQYSGISSALRELSATHGVTRDALNAAALQMLPLEYPDFVSFFSINPSAARHIQSDIGDIIRDLRKKLIWDSLTSDEGAPVFPVNPRDTPAEAALKKKAVLFRHVHGFSPVANLWKTVMPTCPALALSNLEYHLAVQFSLGLPGYRSNDPHPVPCGRGIGSCQTVDLRFDLDHPHACPAGRKNGRNRQHNHFQHQFECLATACGARVEHPQDLSKDLSRPNERPDSLISFVGESFLIDYTGVHATSPSYLRNGSCGDIEQDSMQAMQVAHDNKISKYGEITEKTGLQVRPAVFATTGQLHPSTVALVRAIVSHAPSAAGAECQTATALANNFYARLSVSIQRDNTKIIADCFRHARVRSSI